MCITDLDLALLKEFWVNIDQILKRVEFWGARPKPVIWLKNQIEDI